MYTTDNYSIYSVVHRTKSAFISKMLNASSEEIILMNVFPQKLRKQSMIAIIDEMKQKNYETLYICNRM